MYVCTHERMYVSICMYVKMHAHDMSWALYESTRNRWRKYKRHQSALQLGRHSSPKEKYVKP